MADKRISQLVERTDIANNDVVPIVAFGATTTNKATISSIQEFMQENLDLGVTSVGITLGTTGTDVNVTGSPITTSGNITINIPNASATARGVVSTGIQTFAGIKYFNDTIVANDDIQLVQQGTALPTFIKNISGTFLTAIGSNGIGFNGSNNIYFAGSNKNGGVIAFNNTENRIYTLQDASGTLAFTSDLSGYVTLGTAQTITGQKTFSTSGGSDTTIINHGSGSGIALNITKGGNNEAIRVNKTSGSGNAMTVIGGNFEAPTIVRTGGTSSQFLKADGSVDSNTYLTTASASAAYVPYTGANANLDLGQFDLFADTIRVNGSSPTSGSYLGFKHATTVTTGAEGYTSMYTFGTNTIGFKSVSGATNKDFSFDMSGITANVSGGRVYTLPDASGTLALTSNLSAYLPLSGGTLTGALNGTSASFTGNVGIGITSNANYPLLISRSTAGVGLQIENSTTYSHLRLQSSGTNQDSYLTLNPTGTGNAIIQVGDVNRLTIASTGAATFSSSVTALGNSAIGLAPSSWDAGWLGGNTNSLEVGQAGSSIAAGAGGLFIGNNAVLNGGSFKYSRTFPATYYVQNTALGQHQWWVAPSGTAGNAITFTQAMTLTNAGNVGIGTASPSATDWNGSATLLHLYQNSTNGSVLKLESSNASGIVAAFNNAMALGTTSGDPLIIYTNTTERMRISSSGGVQSTPAVGTNAFSAVVSGTSIAYLTSLASTNDLSGYWQVAGNFAGSITHPTATTTNYNVTSDYRLKENISPLVDGLDSILKLKPVNGNFINDDEKTNMAMFIAHEVQEVVPIAVTGKKDAIKIDKITGEEIMDIQQLDATKLIPYMVKAIQELKAEIDSLKNQIK